MDRGCGFCLFLDESPFMPLPDRVADEEIPPAMYVKLMEKEGRGDQKFIDCEG